MGETTGQTSDHERALRELQRFLDAEFTATEIRTVLDAGCGYTLPVELPAGVRIVGLDTSADALAKNDYIDEAIVGDVETHLLPAEKFDVVLCWTVLEHVADPGRAVSNMAAALRPGGLLVVGVPNFWSLKGLLTKFTPYSFHVWVYRRLWRSPDAGKPGFAPFRTYLRRDIIPSRLALLARRRDLERTYAATYAYEYPLPRPLSSVWSVLATLGRALSLGRWDPRASEHVAVFRKNAPSP